LEVLAISVDGYIRNVDQDLFFLDMSDEERINIMLMTLKDVWLTHPTSRFGQMLWNMLITDATRMELTGGKYDFFYLSDAKVYELLKEYLPDGYESPKSKPK
jgi:hypothetical protein